VWKRTVNGRALHFYLSGINNQNFLMRDRETGSWWQQVSGRAISGPLSGTVLEGVVSDELTFSLWKAEAPHGLVLAPVAGREKDYDGDWEAKVAKYMVPVSFPGQGLKDRDVILGIVVSGQARAYPFDRILAQSPVIDRVGGVPLLLVVGSDGKSVRMFRSSPAGKEIELYADANGPKGQLTDGMGSTWNFQGCAIAGPQTGVCLEQLSYLKDFWFDWRNYHPQTTIYSH
jgi:hypothetical protein